MGVVASGNYYARLLAFALAGIASLLLGVLLAVAAGAGAWRFSPVASPPSLARGGT